MVSGLAAWLYLDFLEVILILVDRSESCDDALRFSFFRRIIFLTLLISFEGFAAAKIMIKVYSFI